LYFGELHDGGRPLIVSQIPIF